MSQPVVLVTGCSAGGIGFSLCEEFATRGCQVYATGRDLKKVRGFAHASIQALALDVSKDEDVERVVKHIIETEGRIDVLVNNAGLATGGAIIDLPLEEVKNMFDINVFGALRLAKAVVPHMASRKRGSIINMGSIMGNIPAPWVGMYAGTKSALHTLTEVLAMECAPLGVHVALVVPGAIRSNISTSAIDSVRLPDDSLYRRYAGKIVEHMHFSDVPTAMPTAVFARRVADAALRARPPRYMTLGQFSTVWAILAWLPRTVALAMLWWNAMD